jgi:hypothetical protein
MTVKAVFTRIELTEISPFLRAALTLFTLFADALDSVFGRNSALAAWEPLSQTV